MRARSPRAAIAAVIAEGFLGRLAFGMLSFALPLYANDLGVSLTQIGFLISLRTVVSLACKPAAGWASDRFGVRPVYLAGSLVRILSVAGLLFADTYALLIAVRALQGASAAARDVASLGVIVRDARTRIGSAYSWYATAKHVGGVAGAAVAGVILGLSGGSFETLFLVVLGLSGLPFVAAWVGLREVGDPGDGREDAAATGGDAPVGERGGGLLAVLRELSGPASVGFLVATSAYMVHGIFPILATEYAGLDATQTGIIYSVSAAGFLVAGPVFGWVVDRRGAKIGVAWRAAANIGSSALYLAWPTFGGLALARSVDDSGKAAFRPAWAVAVADIAAAEPRRRGQRLAALDTSQTAGEVVGPLLAGLLWQTGGVALLFGVRIGIAVIAEVAALSVFGGTHRAAAPPARSAGPPGRAAPAPPDPGGG